VYKFINLLLLQRGIQNLSYGKITYYR